MNASKKSISIRRPTGRHTLLTPTSIRAMKLPIASGREGLPSFFGGMHATVLPEETARHADAVVVGEAEEVWKHVPGRRAIGLAKAFYRSSNLCDLHALPLPRRDLFEAKRYLTTNLVQTTRGCPKPVLLLFGACMAGKTYGRRPIREVIAEIETLSSPLVLFIDDIIVGSRHTPENFSRRSRRLGSFVCSQCSLAIADDDELLGLAALSGCKFLLIGFESLSPENLEDIGSRKVNRISSYETAIGKIHDHGIGVAGTFILGTRQRRCRCIREDRGIHPQEPDRSANRGPAYSLSGTRLHERLSGQAANNRRQLAQLFPTHGKGCFPPGADDPGRA